MAFLGGAECSTAANPLAQFSKQTQNDNSLQRDRLMGRGYGALGESMRSRAAPNGSDQMLNDFAQQGPVPQAFAMDQLRQDLPNLQGVAQRTPSPGGWAVEYDPSEPARMEAAFAGSKMGGQRPPAFNSAEFVRFQSPAQSAQSPARSMTQSPFMNQYSRPMGMGYMGGMGGTLGMYNGDIQAQQQPPQNMADVKGKSRMVELDDQNWEEHFKELETSQDDLSEQANAAMERELEEMDRQLGQDPLTDFDNGAFSSEDYAAWENFDSGLGLGTHNEPFERDPMLGDYMFEAHNPFLENLENSSNQKSAFEQGVEILRAHGNLSLAALAFEAAVQEDPNYVDAWVMLGTTQAQNEKEAPAIRALERSLQIDPNNLDALMGLAVSYTNEGYDSSAYRTLERWLSVKYPQIHPPDQVSEAADVGFTDRAILHDKVTNLFIRAAQLSPSGEQMDPDVQVGLGVLFYGNEDFDKAVDCFQSALTSTEAGISNREDQLHLLWNRLGATLANSGKSEDAITAYYKALDVNPSFVRARYNLGVSCINIGCYPEAAGHLLSALNLHRVAGERGLDQAREIMGDGDPSISDAELERMIQQNESSNLYDTLRRAFSGMGRRDLTEKVGAGMNLDAFRSEFEF